MLRYNASRALKHGAAFGAVVAGWNLLTRVGPLVVIGNLSIPKAVLATLTTFALFGGLAFGILFAGVGHQRADGEISINPWFGWAFAGAIAGFLTGMIVAGSRGENERVVYFGGAFAAAWVALVLLVRLVYRRAVRGGA